MKHLTGTAALIRLILRRDRIRLPIWLLGLIATVVASGSAVQGLYDTPQARENYATTVGSSAASIAMNGPPIALRTIGGITVFEVSMTAVIGVALMAIFLTIRHTRADEESGRTELLLAGVLGRYAPLAAPGIVVGVASAIVGLGISCGFVLGGLPLSGSLLYGTSIAAVGVVFTGVSLVAAQLTEHSRGAMGFALALMGATFLLRAIGDVSDTWVSWDFADRLVTTGRRIRAGQLVATRTLGDLRSNCIHHCGASASAQRHRRGDICSQTRTR